MFGQRGAPLQGAIMTHEPPAGFCWCGDSLLRKGDPQGVRCGRAPSAAHPPRAVWSETPVLRYKTVATWYVSADTESEAEARTLRCAICFTWSVSVDTKKRQAARTPYHGSRLRKLAHDLLDSYSYWYSSACADTARSELHPSLPRATRISTKQRMVDIPAHRRHPTEQPTATNHLAVSAEIDSSARTNQSNLVLLVRTHTATQTNSLEYPVA